MRSCPYVTMFAGNSGLKGVEGQTLPILGGVGGVATKAGYRFVGGSLLPTAWSRVFGVISESPMVIPRPPRDG